MAPRSAACPIQYMRSRRKQMIGIYKFLIFLIYCLLYPSGSTVIDLDRLYTVLNSTTLQDGGLSLSRSRSRSPSLSHVGPLSRSQSPSDYSYVFAFAVDCPENTYLSFTNGFCQPCPSHTLSSSGSVTPDACVCEAGYIFNNATGHLYDCVPCPIGSYQASYNQSSCSPCSENATTLAIASTSGDACVCKAGYTELEGKPSLYDGEKCTACGAGTFKSTEGNGTCVICQEGWSTPSHGSTSVSACTASSVNSSFPAGVSEENYACLAGYGFNSDNGKCEICPVGKFKSGTGNVSCSSCLANAVTASPGSLAATDCKCREGYYGELGSTCLICPAGTFRALSDDSSFCSPCPDASNSVSSPGSVETKDCQCRAGFTGVDGTDACTECESGTFKADAGSASCTPCSYMNTVTPAGKRTSILYCLCDAGYYGDGNGHPPCTPCEEGKFNDDVGGSTCYNCPAHSEYDYDISLCVCKAGYFSPSADKACEECPDNTYKDGAGNTACSVCPANSVSGPSSTSISDCQCDNGYTANVDGDCTPCKAGTYKAVIGSEDCQVCPTDSHSVIGSFECGCDPGFTLSSIGPGECIPCGANTFKAISGSSQCIACPANTISEEESDSFSDCVCMAGYFGTGGNNCTACAPGFYSPSTNSSQCTKCGENLESGKGAVICECGAGYTGSDTVDGEQCSSCEIGTFKNVKGSQPCTLCGPFSSSEGGASICQCDAGAFGEDGGPCQLCEAGTYSNKIGAITCTPCHMNTVSEKGFKMCLCDVGFVEGDDTLCVSCPPGHFCDTVGGIPTPCPAGTYTKSEGYRSEDECDKCPADTYSSISGGVDINACISCPDGFYSLPGSNEISLCFDIDDCQGNPCLNGATCHDAGVDAYMCVCARGWEGVNCTSNIDECVDDPCLNGGICTDHVGFYSCECVGSFYGTNCDLNVNYCAGNPCKNGAICKSLDTGYECDCVLGYGGDTCNDNVDECEGVVCQNGGSCVDYVNRYHCDCPEGVFGANCDYNIDFCLNDPCLNGAACVTRATDYECKCPHGWTGANCETNIDDCAGVTCQNGGSCIDHIGYYRCDCPGFFYGTDCQFNVDYCQLYDQPCQNGGSCFTEENRYTCECANGYSGNNCDIDIDDCADNPCWYGGTCHDGINEYTCDCTPGYEGEACDTDVDECLSDPCMNSATCIDEVDGYQCSCPVGFKGDDCSTDIDECATSPCENGGTCVDGFANYTCACAQGYTGSSCEIEVNECDDDSCLNGGTCQDMLNSFECMCAAGFEGEDCSVNTDECADNPCMNGGDCIDLINAVSCLCAKGFAGSLCETDIDNCESLPCKNGATCKDLVDEFQCLCPLGYEGDRCQHNIDECKTAGLDKCQNDAACVDGIYDYSCECKLGYSGHHCEVNIDDCRHMPCANGGTCVDGVSVYTCACQSGYAGDMCEVDETPCAVSHLGNPCLNGGRCINPGSPQTNAIDGRSCDCSGTKWTGDICEVDNSVDCASSPCLNGAVCTDADDGEFTCACPEGFSGTVCSNVEATPTLVSATVEDSYASVALAFDRPTDGGLIADSSPDLMLCAKLLSFDTMQLLGVDPRCEWYAQRSILVIHRPGTGTWDLVVGDTISLVPGIIRNANSLSRPIGYNMTGSAIDDPLKGGKHALSTNLTLADGLEIPQVSAALSGPESSDLKSCDAISLSTRGSTGSAGQNFRYSWVLANQPSGVSKPDVEVYMNSINALEGNRGWPEVAIPDTYLPPNRDYEFEVTLTNWLGFTSDPVSVTVNKPAIAAPTVSIVGPPLFLIEHSSKLKLTAEVSQSQCLGSTSLSYRWLLIDVKTTSPSADGFAGSVPLDHNSQYTSTLEIGANSLQPGHVYTFQVEVLSQLLDLIEFASASVKVEAQSASAPTLDTNAHLSLMNEGENLQISLTFDKATNRAGMWAGSTCDEILTESTLGKFSEKGSLRCKWVSASQMDLSWEGDFDFGDNDAIRIRAGVVQSADGVSRYAGVMSTYVVFPTPSDTPSPVVQLDGPDQVSNCDSVHLSGAASSGGAGRAMSYAWKLLNTHDAPGLSPTQRRLLNLQLSEAPRYTSELTIPGPVFPIGMILELELEATNWMGRVSTAAKTVEKSNAALPSLSIRGSAVVTLSRYDAVMVVIDIMRSQCDSRVTSNEPLVVEWQQLDSWASVSSAWITTVSPTNATFHIPAETLTPGTEYSFQMIATDTDDSGSVSHLNFVVNVEQVASPTLASAQFSNSFMRITVVFTADTDQGAIMSTSDACAIWTGPTLALLGSTDTLSCYWADKRTLNIVMGRHPSIARHGVLEMKDNAIQSHDAFSSPALGQSVVVSDPHEMPEPKAALRGAATVGSCEHIELSGELSSGSGGRWISFEWSVKRDPYFTALSVDAYEAIDAFLADLPVLSRTVSMPASLLPAGCTYRFTLKVTNWLGDSDSTTRNVQKAAVALPFLEIAGLDTRSVRSDEAVTVVANSFASSCDENAVVAYTWETAFGTDFTIPDQFKSSCTLYIAPYTLPPGETVELRVSATAEGGDTVLTNTALLTLNVQNSDLFARIEGGNRLVSLGASNITEGLTIDGRATHDPDFNDEDGTKVDNAMVLKWECVRKIMNSPCFPSDKWEEYMPPNAYVFIVPVSALQPTIDDDVYVFTLKVSKGTRYAEDTVEISITQRATPIVSLFNTSGFKHPLGDKLTLTSTVASGIDGKVTSLSDPNRFMYRWICTSGNLDLSDSSLLSSSTTDDYLVIKANVLSGGVAYRFVLEVTEVVSNATELILDTGKANIIVFANAPPSPGLCYSDPPAGTALDTFQLTCTGWSDDRSDLPLEYKFEVYSETTGSWSEIGFYQGANTIRTRLAPGEARKDYKRQVLGYVRDNSGCWETYEFQVTVAIPTQVRPSSRRRLGDDDDGPYLQTLWKDELPTVLGLLRNGDWNAFKQWIYLLNTFMDMAAEQHDCSHPYTAEHASGRVALRLGLIKAVNDAVAIAIPTADAQQALLDIMQASCSVSKVSSCLKSAAEGETPGNWYLDELNHIRVECANFMASQVSATQENAEIMFRPTMSETALSTLIPLQGSLGDSSATNEGGGDTDETGDQVAGRSMRVAPGESDTQMQEVASAISRIVESSLVQMTCGSQVNEDVGVIKVPGLTLSSSKQSRDSVLGMISDVETSVVTAPSSPEFLKNINDSTLVLSTAVNTNSAFYSGYSNATTEGGYDGTSTSTGCAIADSPIVTVSIFSSCGAKQSITTGESDAFRICIDHDPLVDKDADAETESVAYCAYWDESLHQYSTLGCVVDGSKSTDTRTCCLCNHLTDFAILSYEAGIRGTGSSVPEAVTGTVLKEVVVSNIVEVYNVTIGVEMIDVSILQWEFSRGEYNSALVEGLMRTYNSGLAEFSFATVGDIDELKATPDDFGAVQTAPTFQGGTFASTILRRTQLNESSLLTIFTVPRIDAGFSVSPGGVLADKTFNSFIQVTEPETMTIYTTVNVTVNVTTTNDATTTESESLILGDYTFLAFAGLYLMASMYAFYYFAHLLCATGCHSFLATSTFGLVAVIALCRCGSTGLYWLAEQETEFAVDFEVLTVAAMFPYILQFWVYSLVVFAWASIYYRRKSYSVNPFQTVKVPYAIFNIIVVLCMMGVFGSVLMIDDVDFRQDMLLHGAIFTSSLCVLQGVGFYYYGSLLCAELTKDFPSRHARKIFRFAIMWCVCLFILSADLLYSILFPDGFEQHYRYCTIVYYSADLCSHVLVFIMFNRTVSDVIGDPQKANNSDVSRYEMKEGPENGVRERTSKRRRRMPRQSTAGEDAVLRRALSSIIIRKSISGPAVDDVARYDRDKGDVSVGTHPRGSRMRERKYSGTSESEMSSPAPRRGSSRRSNRVRVDTALSRSRKGTRNQTRMSQRDVNSINNPDVRVSPSASSNEVHMAQRKRQRRFTEQQLGFRRQSQHLRENLNKRKSMFQQRPQQSHPLQRNPLQQRHSVQPHSGSSARMKGGTPIHASQQRRHTSQAYRGSRTNNETNSGGAYNHGSSNPLPPLQRVNRRRHGDSRRDMSGGNSDYGDSPPNDDEEVSSSSSEQEQGRKRPDQNQGHTQDVGYEIELGNSESSSDYFDEYVHEQRQSVITAQAQQRKSVLKFPVALATKSNSSEDENDDVSDNDDYEDDEDGEDYESSESAEL